MAQNGGHNHGERITSMRVDDDVVIFDAENSEAWMQSAVSVTLEDAA